MPEDIVKAKEIKEQIQQLKQRAISENNPELEQILNKLEAMGETELAQASMNKLNVTKAANADLQAISTFGANKEDLISGVNQVADQMVAGKNTIAGSSEIDRLRKLIKRFTKQDNPELMTRLEETTSNLKLSKDSQVGLNRGNLSVTGLMTALAGSPKMAALKTANLAGQTVKAVTDITKKVTVPIVEKARQTSQLLNGATPEILATKSQELRAAGTKVGENLANILDKVVGENNPRTRNALMFGIQQNPEYRKLLGIDSTKDDNK